MLPIERIVKHDFSIAEAVPSQLHVAIFQGSDDTRTPLADFGLEAGGAERSPIFEVPGGTHTDTMVRAKAEMITAMLGMIRGSDEALATGRMED